MPPLVKNILLSVADSLPDISNILLAVLGVLMSFPAKADEIEKNPFWRKVVAYTCIGVALAGLIASTYQRRHFNSQITQLLGDDDRLLVNTNGLVGTTNTMVTNLGLLIPRLSWLDAHIADLNVKIAEAKERHDPRLIADLQAEATTARAQVDATSRQILLAMVPGIYQQLSVLGSQWHAEDGHILSVAGLTNSFNSEETRKKRSNLANVYLSQLQPLMITANYLRHKLLQELRPADQTAEDKTEEEIFSKGQSIKPEEVRAAAMYLFTLSQRIAAVPSPPTNIAGTAQ
jgi:hypothetical protein